MQKQANFTLVSKNTRIWRLEADIPLVRIICTVMTRTRSVKTALLAGMTLTACVSAPPPPERPNFDLASDTFAAAPVQIFAAEPVTIAWWERFEDPVLTQLVQTALIENKDLAVAAANIETARASLNRQTLNQSYSTSANASGDVGRAARDGADVEVSGSGTLGASWEFDAYGGIAAQIESAARQVEVFEEVRRDLAVTVAAETALAYVDYRGNQVRLDVAQTNAALQSDSVELLNALFENGRATRLDVERAEAQYRTTLASLPLLEINIRSAAIRLAVLTGRTDFETATWLDAPAPSVSVIPAPPASLNIGAPEALIRRRPDIRAAEADIARLLALGDVERARLFPTLTFNANILALFTEDNTSAESFGFGIGPALSWEGPDLRRVRADIEIADAQTRAAYADYESAVVAALGEVETALVSYAQEQSRQPDLMAASASAERALELAQLRFEEGLDDFFDVIDAQRTLLDAQDRLESNRLATTRQAISTYRALGGIWQDDELAQTLSESE
ncbi:MAG: TolC family protein [Pseudomonadota bacterium]